MKFKTFPVLPPSHGTNSVRMLSTGHCKSRACWSKTPSWQVRLPWQLETHSSWWEALDRVGQSQENRQTWMRAMLAHNMLVCTHQTHFDTVRKGGLNEHALSISRAIIFGWKKCTSKLPPSNLRTCSRLLTEPTQSWNEAVVEACVIWPAHRRTCEPEEWQGSWHEALFAAQWPIAATDPYNTLLSVEDMKPKHTETPPHDVRKQTCFCWDDLGTVEDNDHTSVALIQPNAKGRLPQHKGSHHLSAELLSRRSPSSDRPPVIVTHFWQNHCDETPASFQGQTNCRTEGHVLMFSAPLLVLQRGAVMTALHWEAFILLTMRGRRDHGGLMKLKCWPWSSCARASTPWVSGPKRSCKPVTWQVCLDANLSTVKVLYICWRRCTILGSMTQSNLDLCLDKRSVRLFLTPCRNFAMMTVPLPLQNSKILCINASLRGLCHPCNWCVRTQRSYVVWQNLDPLPCTRVRKD